MNGPTRAGGSAKWKWWVPGLVLVTAVPLFCCCGLFMLGALSPAPSPSRPVPSPSPTAGSTMPVELSAGSTPRGPAQPPEPSLDTPEAPVAHANRTGESPAPAEGPAEVQVDEGLPGIGATRAHWEATHQRAPGFAPGTAFGPMLRSETGRGLNPTYAAVVGDDRIEHYSMQLPSPGLPFDVARARAARELPADAREVRTRRLGACRMVRYRSATLRRLYGRERHRGDVEVAFFSPSPEFFDPRHVTLLTFAFYFGEDIRC